MSLFVSRAFVRRGTREVGVSVRTRVVVGVGEDRVLGARVTMESCWRWDILDLLVSWI